MLRAIFYAYILGGLTFIPLLIAAFVFITIYTSVPVGDPDVTKKARRRLEADSLEKAGEDHASAPNLLIETNDNPKSRKGWLTMRRTFEETVADGGYVTLVRSFLDARSKDPKRSRPKDMWYVVLKGKVLYLYEDEDMTECEAAVELSSHRVVIYPEGLPDAELFAKRNAICLKPKGADPASLSSLTMEMRLNKEDIDEALDATGLEGRRREKQREVLQDVENKQEAAREQAFDPSTPWYIFVRSNTEMEDWYLSLVHASEQPSPTPTLTPLRPIFDPADMNHLVSTLDEQPDVIPMRWLNALLGRIFFSHYRTDKLEAYIIGRLMKKLSKVKIPAFLSNIAVTEVSVGNRPPMMSKPMLKELTKEGDASLEVHLAYKGEIRITVEATAVINLGARFKSYTVKLVLAAVLKELEGNLLIKVKRPPSNRIWYAFTQTPRIVMEVEPIVSDRQLTWGMILSTIESKFKEIIQESVVMPNMDDIAFFETDLYEHRGGIWPDACRKPHEPLTQDPVPDDIQSVASAPLPEIPPLEPSPLSTTKPSEPTIRPTSPQMTDPSSITSSSGEETSDTSSASARRRTWFSSVRDDVPFVQSEPKTAELNLEGRGRPLEFDDLTPTQAIAHRSLSAHSIRSAPGKPESVSSTQSEQSQVQIQDASVTPSQHSSPRHPNHSDITDDQEEYLFRSDTKPVATTPRRVSDASQKQRSPSPPSFFSTLKSKAADKQALSNTAKEAMRKWGVNWGGFKKEFNNGSGEDVRTNTSSSRPEVSPDSNIFTHKPRASYAEVRAAVTERKERERTAHSGEEVSSPTVIDKLQRPLSLLPGGSVYSDTPSNPSIVTSAARLNAPKLSSKKSSPSIGTVNAEIDSSNIPKEDHVKPIHVQPQAKTMSIPGIHASHRGEVQSLGYVAPQPPAPSGPAENVLMNPAIQTVYRLWKTPSQAASQTQIDGQTIQTIDDTISRTPSSEINITKPSPAARSPPKNPTPPTLPPRVALSHDSPNPVSSSAAQALRTIVAKDDDLIYSQSQQESIPNTLTPQNDSINPEAITNKPEDASLPLDGPVNSDLVPSLGNQSASNAPPPLPPRRPA